MSRTLSTVATFSLSLALSLASSGCFTSWLAVQATGQQKALDEGVREQAVPQPGIEERLVLSYPAPETPTSPSSSPASTARSPGLQADQPPRFSLRCRVEQSARDAVYHSAFRYGSRWKKATAIAFAVEASFAALLVLTATEEKPNGYLYGGYLALDAVGTAATFFIPRKEIYRVDEKPVVTTIRTDCPDGLTVTIGEDTFPVDAAGRIGELGDIALAEWRASAPRDPTLPAWQAAPRVTILVTYDGRTVELAPGGSATLQVPPGSLTRVP